MLAKLFAPPIVKILAGLSALLLVALAVQTISGTAAISARYPASSRIMARRWAGLMPRTCAGPHCRCGD